MSEQVEGPFVIRVLVGQSPYGSNRWNAAARLHFGEEVEAVETVALEDNYRTEAEARAAATEAGRALARRLPGDHSYRKKLLATEA
jgi:hypothetical protein